MSDRLVTSARLEDYCINISQFYVNHWEDIHAFREALQNWRDAWRAKYPNDKLSLLFQENNVTKIYRFYLTINGIKNLQNYIQYDEGEKSMKMVNEGSFKIENLLMGNSSKDLNPLLLGQYGQGMKLFFLILLNKGYPLYIESGDYVYCPFLGQWKYEYKGKVLHVKVNPRLNKKDNTCVVIKRVSKQKFLDFRYLSLMLVSDYIHIQCPKMRLIISQNPKLQGKLLKKGILVAMRYNINCKYSFDFDDINLGRDRDSINDPQAVKKLCSQMLAYILNNYETLEADPNLIYILQDIVKQIVRLLEVNGFCTWYVYSLINLSSAERLYRFFLRQNGKEELYPTNDGGPIEIKLNKYGLSKSFYPYKNVSWQYYHCLIKTTTKYQSVDIKIQKEVLNQSKRQLIDLQKNQLKAIKDNIALSLPQINGYNFMASQINGLACYRSEDKQTIYINNHEMRNVQSFKRKLMNLILIDSR